MPHPATSPLVAVAWLGTCTGLAPAMVATTLPKDNATWAASGFVQVDGVVGGTPHRNLGLRAPVLGITCWAVNPNSSKPPWGKSAELAERVRAATLDEPTIRRTLTLGPVDFHQARVLEAELLSEPSRYLADDGSYARTRFDLYLRWIELP